MNIELPSTHINLYIEFINNPAEVELSVFAHILGHPSTDIYPQWNVSYVQSGQRNLLCFFIFEPKAEKPSDIILVFNLRNTVSS